MLKSLPRNSLCVFVQATLPTCRYVVIRESAGAPVLITAGSVDIEGYDELARAVQTQLAGGPNVSRAVLLLPRGEIEVHSLRLPPATEEEVPELVVNLIQQQVEENFAGVHDFVVSQQHDDDGRDVLTFTVSEERLQIWQQGFKQHGFKLEAICFGGLGAVSLLNQIAQRPAKTSIVVTTTDQDTDLAVVEDERPTMFRTIPRATSAETFVIDQLAADIQRALALKEHSENEESRVYLIGTKDPEQSAAAKRLNEQTGLPVSLVNPFDQLAGDVQQAVSIKRPSRFANLIGTACAWNQQALLTNLLAPKKPPQAPSLWSRYGFWVSVAACLLAFGGYLLWEQTVEANQEIEAERVKLQRLIQPVKKSQTKQAIVGAVNRWKANDINWLDELWYLSEKLPPAEDITIGNLTMNAPAGQLGQINMPVVISESELRATLEEAINDARHSITNGRLTNVTQPGPKAWRFQSTISIRPAAPLVVAENEPSQEATSESVSTQDAEAQQ